MNSKKIDPANDLKFELRHIRLYRGWRRAILFGKHKYLSWHRWAKKLRWIFMHFSSLLYSIVTQSWADDGEADKRMSYCPRNEMSKQAGNSRFHLGWGWKNLLSHRCHLLLRYFPCDAICHKNVANISMPVSFVIINLSFCILGSWKVNTKMC